MSCSKDSLCQSAYPKKKYTIVFVAVYSLIWLLSFFKCRYGYPIDESVHLLIPLRFVWGDIPIIHEKIGIQFSSIWTYPFCYAYYHLVGSTNGIFLANRIAFNILWGIFGLFLFYRLRHISLIGAMISSFTIFLFVPFDLMSLYYNTIGQITLISSCVIILTAERFPKAQFIIAGFLFAIAVTTCPYTLSIYVWMLILAAIKRDFGLFKKWIFVSIGSLSAFIIFCLFYFKNCSLSTLIDMLQYISTDPTHTNSVTEKIVTYFTSSAQASFLTPLVFVFSPVIALWVKIKRSNTSRLIGTLAVVISVIILQISFFILGNNTNHYMVGLVAVGIYCYIVSDDPMIKKLFYALVVPSILYSISLHIASNTLFMAISSGGALGSVAGILMIFLLINESGGLNSADQRLIRLLKAASVSLFSIQILLLLFLRFTAISCDGSISKMTNKVDSGAMSGLYITDDRYDLFCRLSTDIDYINHNYDYSNILILSSELWPYLDVNGKPATYISWIYLVSPELLHQFYTDYPDKSADVIYIDDIYSDTRFFFETIGYEEDQHVTNGVILKKK